MKSCISIIFSFLLTVVFSQVTAQPSITSSPVTTAVAGSLYTYTVHADGNQANMVYSLIEFPDGMSINPSSGAISWTPASNNVNSTVVVKADNGVAPADTQKFRIFIAEAPSCNADIIAVYRLDESNGPTYADVKGLRNASGVVSPTATTGKIDGAQVFTDQTKLHIPDLSNEWDWSASSSFSMECWVKTSVDTRIQAYISRYNADPDVREISTAWWLGQTSTGNAALEIKDYTNHNSVLFSNKKIADGQWHHVVGVRNSATQHNKIYVDGVEVADMSVALPGGFTCPQPTPVTLGYMKRTYDSDPEYHLNGALDEVAFYQKALTADEITQLYNNGLPKGHCGPGNYAPVIASDPSVKAYTGIQYTYNFVAEDIDNATLTLSVVNKPDWLNFSYVSGEKQAVLSGTPGTPQEGEYTVTLRADDGKVMKDQTFILTVLKTNHSPVVNSAPSLSVQEGSAYTYNLTVADEDTEDNISITAVSIPGWLEFTVNGKTATITGTPEDDDCGVFNLSFLITDMTDTIFHNYNLNVVQVNDAPVITSEAPTEVNSGSIYLYYLTAEDSDDDALTFSVVSKPAWLNFSPQTGLLSGMPGTNDNGSVLVILRVSDGTVYTEQYIAIDIVNVVSTGEISSDDLIIYPVPATESVMIRLEKEAATLSVYSLTGALLKTRNVPQGNSIYRLDISDLNNGNYFLKIDGNGGSNTYKFSIAR